MNNAKTDTQKVIIKIIRTFFTDKQNIFSAAISFFLGMCTLIDGVNPFGIAMLTATSIRVNAFFVGSFAASIFAGYMTIPMLVANFFVFITKKYLSNGNIPTTRIRVTLSTLAAIFLAISRYMLGTRLFYTAAESIIFYSILPLFTILYMGLNKRDAFLGRWHKEAGLLAAAFSLTIVMSAASFSYFSLGTIWACALTLVASKRGMASGCLTGFVCGLGCFDAMLLPMLGLLGLTAGLLMERNKNLASFSAGFVAIAFTAAASEPQKLILTGLCIICGIGIFYLAESANLDKLLSSNSSKRSEIEIETDTKFGQIAKSFSTLANVFFNSCEAASIKTAEISIPLKECEGCSGCSINGLDEAENNLKLQKIVRGESDRMPRYFNELCPNAENIVNAANAASENSKSGKELKHIAEQYLDFAKILECVAQREAERTSPMPEKEEKVCAALLELELRFEKVVVIGGRRRQLEVIGIKPEEIKCSTSELRYSLSKAVGTMLGEPRFMTIGDCNVMRMETIPAVAVEYAQISGAAYGERVNGDTVSVFENDDGRFFALISDGMGSGSSAASSSRLTAIFLEKLLQMGADKNESIRLLNKLLIAKDGETFACVDLAEIDRVKATISITKAGAAPSLLIRDSAAHLIKSGTPPTGIIDEVEAEQTSFRLKRGDWILMFSDGVLGGSDRIPLWMLKIIENGKYSSPGELAMKINEGAKRAYAMNDDMTTLAMRIA